MTYLSIPIGPKNIRMSQVSHTNESRLIYEPVMSHVCMIHDTHRNVSCSFQMHRMYLSIIDPRGCRIYMYIHTHTRIHTRSLSHLVSLSFPPSLSLTHTECTGFVFLLLAQEGACSCSVFARRSRVVGFSRLVSFACVAVSLVACCSKCCSVLQ